MTAQQITIVAHDIGPVGGMERQLTELVAGLVARGNDVTVIARSCSLARELPIRFVRVRSPSRPFALAYPLFLLVGTLAVVRHRRGVLHVTGAIVLNRADVCTIHLSHHGWRATGLLRMRRRTIWHRLNARVAGWMSLVAERVCLPRARSLVAVSARVAEEVRDGIPAVADRVVVIPNGVDATRFTPADSPRGSLRAVFVGSEWGGKGLRFAIEALREAPGWGLDVLGDGDRTGFEQIASELGVAERVTFHGRRSDPEAFYALASAFVLPSIYETFSLVTYEAAAAGLPLLATRVGGVEELLRPGVNGWFIRRDAGDIAARLRELGQSGVLREQMGREARQAALGFTWTAMVDRYAKLYAA